MAAPRNYNPNRAPVASVQIADMDPSVSETHGNKTALYTHNVEDAYIQLRS